MSPILDIQRRLTEVGRIRIGARDGNRPTKLSTFRVTSQSRDLVEAVAEVYGGTPQEWKPGPKEPVQWEVLTEADTLNIVVAPGQVLTQWYELWSGGGCQRRCDGETEMLSDAQCICPADLEQRREMAAKGGACKPTTRLSVMLRDVAALGLWRLESHGFYAAVELAGAAELLAYATKNGSYIPATLRLEQRTTRRDGKTNRFAVPVIDIRAPVGKVLESLGAMDADELSAPPAPKALPAPARAALPAAPRGRQKEPLPAPPPLPDDVPAFSVDPSPITPSSTAPLPGADQATKRSQQLHISARNSGVSDLLEDLVEHVTDGRTRSTKDVTDDEASALHEAFSLIKRGRKTVSYREDGRLVLS